MKFDLWMPIIMYYQAYHFLHQRKYSQKIEGKRRERTIQRPLIHLSINSDHSPLSVFTQQAHIISFLAFASHRIFKLSISFSNILFPSVIPSVTGAFFLSLYYFWQQKDFFSPLPLTFTYSQQIHGLMTRANMVLRRYNLSLHAVGLCACVCASVLLFYCLTPFNSTHLSLITVWNSPEFPCCEG